MTIKTQPVLQTKTFFSLKNQTKFSYQTEAEHLIMAQLEFDLTVIEYTQFEFMMGTPNGSAVSPGFIAKRDDSKEFIVLNNILAANKQLAARAETETLRNEFLAGRLTVYCPAHLVSSVRAQNIAFLYKHAIELPSFRCGDNVRKFFDCFTESSIKWLKMLLGTESVIYYLLFHRGLQADLAYPITDDTEVTLGPLIGSVMRRLWANNGGTNE